MTEEHVPATYKRRLVVIAVSEYDDGTPARRTAFREGISAQVAVIEDWWNSPHLDDQRRFTPSHPPKPVQCVHDLRAFLIDENLIEAQDDEALVIYLTGHGLAPAGGRHFLRLPDTHTDRPLATAFPTAELIAAALDSPAEHVLVMVDSCFSGRLAEELDSALKALHPDRHALSSLVVLTAGNENSTPRLRAFTSALAAVHAYCADEANGYAASHLSWEDFHAILEAVWNEAQMADIHVLWPPRSVSRQLAARELSPCLPNPGHTDTSLIEDARSQLGWTRRDLDDYWISRATGQMSGDTGWYFTGRATLVTRINAFLAGDDNALVVTGQAGSGKSALLARLVTLSDPRFCDNPAYRTYLEAIPEELKVPVGAIDAAVLARNTEPPELAAALYQALTGRHAQPGQETSALLLAHARAAVDRTGRPLTVVVDGIDEARNPRRVITDVLRPLARLRRQDRPAIRLILGIRSSPPPARRHLPGHGPADERLIDELRHTLHVDRGLLDLLRQATHAPMPLRTDDDSARDDIAAYTAALLRTEPAAGTRLTYRNDEDVRDVAAAIAEEVSPSFLDARLAAQQLHARPYLPSPSDTRWRRQLRQGTQELLRQDLADVAQHTRTRPENLLAVLRATAFALGAGLPWASVWPAAVHSLEPGCDAPETAIRVVRDSRLTGYLTTAVEDGRTVYRPIHERVSETLRTAPHTLLVQQPLPDTADTSSVAAHRSLTGAFSRLLADAPEQPPHPYLRRHLIAHAEEGQVLDDTHVPASFLPFESQGRIRGTLGLPLTPQPATQRLSAWARIEPFLADAPPEARADSLALAERATDDQPSPLPPAMPRSPSLTARWNHLALPGNILAGTTNDIYDLVTFRTADQTSIVAAGHADGTVTMWDTHTGQPFGAPFTQLGRHARTMAVTEATTRRGDPRLLVGTDKGLWHCDPDTGDIRRLLPGRIRAITPFTSPEHGPLLAVAEPHAVLILDPHTGQIIQSRDRHDDRRTGTVHALEPILLPGGQVLLALGEDGSHVPLLDAHTLETVGELPGQGMGTAALQSFTTQSGEVRLAIASRSGKGVRIFDLLTLRQERHAPIRQSVSSMALCPRPYAEPLLLLGSGTDGRMTVIDTATGEELPQLPAGHTQPVRALAVLPAAGPPHRTGPGRPPSHPGRHLVVSGSLDGTIRLWQPDREDIAHTPPTDSSARHVALLPQSDGPPRLLSGNDTSRISEHSLHTGRSEPIHYVEDLPGRRITALAASDQAQPGYPGLLAVGYSNGSLYLHTEEGEQHELREPSYPAHRRGHVRTMAFLPGPPDSPVLAAGFTDARLEYFHLGERPTRSWATQVADGPVRCLAVTPTGEPPLLAVADRTVRLLEAGRKPYARLPQSVFSAHSLAFITAPALPGLFLATGGADGAIRLWDPQAPRQEALPVLHGHRGRVTALTALHHPSHTQPLLISASSDDTSIRIWEYQTGEEIQRLVTAAPITSLVVLPSEASPTDSPPTIVFGSPRGIGAVTVHL
ncbi:AAA family ATPase [Streptomyces sp. NPDC006173]|uniref:AAA family ATPase n=1 Tax=Streptomyces sp. NPDC006173 TaxID=3155349 RepID=UPI003402B2CA